MKLFLILLLFTSFGTTSKQATYWLANVDITNERKKTNTSLPAVIRAETKEEALKIWEGYIDRYIRREGGYQIKGSFGLWELTEEEILK